MTTEEAPVAPKRRGRPPGSKNKPKTVVPPPAPPEDFGTQTIGSAPLPLPEFAAELVSIEVPTIKVVLQFRAGLSSAIDTQPVDWPANWPLPDVHDRVVFAVDGRQGGQVAAINYRLDLGEIHILLT